MSKADIGLQDGAAEEGAHRSSIVFNLEAEQNHDASALQEEREKHKKRADKFGTQYKDPGRTRRDFGLMMEARKERMRAGHGFTTGLDVLSKEEQEKRAARANRFQLPEPLPAAAALDAYRPDEELEARARRAAKFGVQYQPTEAVLMDMDLFEQRREVPSSVERRPTAIYLYGVDVMSTRDCMSYFGDYGPVFVEWLDDSSCNVLFDDVNSVRRALVGKGTPLPPEVITEERYQHQHGQAHAAAVAAAEAAAQAAEEAAGGPDAAAAAAAAEAAQQAAAAAQAAQAAAQAAATLAPPSVRYQPELPMPDNLADIGNLPYIWHKGKDFLKNGTPVSLVYRMATSADVRDMSAPKRTRELWKAGGGGGGGQQRRGKRTYHSEDGPADMDVDGEEGEGGDGDVSMKRGRGVRAGRRHTRKELNRHLKPYGGTAALVPGAVAEGGDGTVLPSAAAVVLDYTELEDEGAPGGGGGASGGGAEEGQAEEGGGEGGRGGRGRRRGGRGRGGGRGGREWGQEEGQAPAFEGDLRDVLKARRAAARAEAGHGDGDAGEQGHSGGE